MASESNSKLKEDERLKLAAKLDKDLDEFIVSQQCKPYTEGWHEATWQQEIEQHPFFMTKLPEEGEPLPPLLEAIQQLKYDPEQNTAEELALSHKESGNFNFKMKKYRFAIASYTEGLKQKCGNPEMDASLYLNRAAAHYHLGNYRSSLNDSLLAAKLKPDYVKAIVRATQCCLQLKRFADGLQWCDYGLRLNNSDPLVLTKFRTELVQGQKLEERNKRKAEVAEKKEQLKTETLLKALQVRGICTFSKGKVNTNATFLDMSSLEPCHPAAVGKPVRLEGESLIWPVLFLYPEYGETDFIQEFHEDTSFLDQMQEMFEPLPPWDAEAKYKISSIRIYYENLESGKLHTVNPKSSLRTVLTQSSYVVRAGTPGFICLVEGSHFQQEFLKNYTIN